MIFTDHAILVIITLDIQYLEFRNLQNLFSIKNMQLHQEGNHYLKFWKIFKIYPKNNENIKSSKQ